MVSRSLALAALGLLCIVVDAQTYEPLMNARVGVKVSDAACLPRFCCCTMQSSLFTDAEPLIVPNLQPPDPRHLPWAGNGTCEAPVYDSNTGLTEVHCLGPRHPLSPGQARHRPSPACSTAQSPAACTNNNCSLSMTLDGRAFCSCCSSSAHFVSEYI